MSLYDKRASSLKDKLIRQDEERKTQAEKRAREKRENKKVEVKNKKKKG